MNRLTEEQKSKAEEVYHIACKRTKRYGKIFPHLYAEFESEFGFSVVRAAMHWTGDEEQFARILQQRLRFDLLEVQSRYYRNRRIQHLPQNIFLFDYTQMPQLDLLDECEYIYSLLPSDRHRTVFQSRFALGLTCNQTGKILNLSKARIISLTYDGYERLEDVLGPLGFPKRPTNPHANILAS